MCSNYPLSPHPLISNSAENMQNTITRNSALIYVNKLHLLYVTSFYLSNKH